MNTARYVVGIDLGTTNTLVSYIDQNADAPAKNIRIFEIDQHIAPETTKKLSSLASFIYLPTDQEQEQKLFQTDHSNDATIATCIGEFAREQAGKIPSRVISSSKSWLCHGGIDRKSDILPYSAPKEVKKLSPFKATSLYLNYLKEAWNATFSEHRLEHQDVVLTVPASFDAVARELTLEAAKSAELNVLLIEEPQAAFYAWLANHEENWRNLLNVGESILVCDVGGGTTDFTLINVEDESGNLKLERFAVGDHILLGGDNMDLTLALSIAEDLKEKNHTLDAWQTRSLWHACRKAKEELFEQPDLEQTKVSILGRSSKVIGGTIKAELTKETLENILLEGFFPQVSIDDHPKKTIRKGLAELGLPYATDAAITRHLAYFLSEHGKDGHPIAPSGVLFNGGVMKAELLRKRVLSTLKEFAPRREIRELLLDDETLNLRLDQSVSHGAAYYGMVRQGKGIRIRGGIARSYYIGIESSLPAVPGFEAPMKALCVAPFGMEEGSSVHAGEQEFGMVIGEPVEFRFLSSTTRKDDQAGELIESWRDDEIEELVPIHTSMQSDNDNDKGQLVPVKLQATVDEVGSLHLKLIANDDRDWKLSFDIRRHG